MGRSIIAVTTGNECPFLAEQLTYAFDMRPQRTKQAMPNMRLMPNSTTGDFATAPSALGNIGLLAIRLGIGATMLHFGLQKFLAFGSSIEAMRSDGWRAPAFAALLNAGAETVGDTPTHNG